MKFDPLFVQFLGFFRRGFAVDRAVIGLAVMDFARFLRETGTDIVRVLGDVLAQFLEFLPQLALGRRHHGDRRFSGWYRRRLNWRRRGRARRHRQRRASRGAMIAFSTLAEPQTGQATSPRFDCLSYAAEFWNQLSNVWPWSQLSA